MTDRELLELAAKAIGKSYVDGDSWDEGAGWNPLTDDGDALRLAVKLGIGVHFNVYRKEDCAIAGSDGSYQEQKLCDDPYAATRRAIVRAAADIGRGM